MKVIILLIAFINECFSQTGFPTQFQATLNITGASASQSLYPGLQQVLFDLTNTRVRIDIRGWRAKQKEAYILKNKPDGAESGSPASQGMTMFNFNPDYPEFTKNNCWYRTDPLAYMGPFPEKWSSQTGNIQVKAWFPLPTDLINKGEEWIPEIKQKATRYDSPAICDLKRSGIGRVPCLSYFETADRPVKTITARAAVGAYDSDDYISTFYLSFTHGITPDAEQLFNLPNHWPSFCGNANTGFSIESIRGFVVTPEGQDHFTLRAQAPPVSSLGDEIRVEFKVIPNWYYNGTRCAKFDPIIFNKDNWQTPQQVNMSFGDYGCCTYAITGSGGGYDWQYTTSTFAVYACDGQAGYGCKGKEPCGA